MKNLDARGLTSLDLSPLPHESTLSAVWRLAWRNVLFGAALKTRLGLMSIKHISLNGNQVRLLNAASHAVGWPLISSHEHRSVRVMGGYRQVWFCEDLCMCPLCMECGYHSIWFQFKPLGRCPLHGCRLSKQCAHCGGGLGRYELNSSRTYLCMACGQSFCGAEINLDAHLDFRCRHDEIDRAFSPYSAWLEAFYERCSMLFTLNSPSSDFLGNWQGWCRADSLLLSLSHEMHPLPGECDVPPYQHMLIKHWKTAIDNSSELKPVRCTTNVDLHMETACYRNVLDRIIKWVASKRGAEPDARNRQYIVCLGERLLADVFPTLEEAALTIFRMHFESIYWEVDISHAQVVREIKISMPWRSGRSVILPLRCTYIAAYIGLLYVLDKISRDGKIDLRNCILREEMWIAQTWSTSSNTLHGFILLPLDIPELLTADWLEV